MFLSVSKLAAECSHKESAGSELWQSRPDTVSTPYYLLFMDDVAKACRILGSGDLETLHNMAFIQPPSPQPSPRAAHR